MGKRLKSCKLLFNSKNFFINEEIKRRDLVRIIFFKTFRKHESNEEKQEKNSDASDAL